ncbi:MAG: hypothetical protein LQ348_000520 [Seirophora lacunosa]|nr:MAG: hypothetical protein LQ348_000520 [Seirophora lacunosa]
MRIAIEGCGHGTLHAIYASITNTCQVQGWDGVDLLIIGGDFQAVRNSYDLNAMSIPAKYRAIGDFHEYYSGARVAPYLTLFVGGNHEASNHLWELYYGGWVAPNIYYMGAANVVNFGSLRIAGLSGIWAGYDYKKAHHERLPYGPNDVKSIYHVRELDIRKLLQVRTQVDVGISHDWPRKIEWQGDYTQLFRFKPHFKSDAQSGRLGSLAAMYVMNRLRPRWWFAAHLHCKYSAIVEFNRVADSTPVTNSTGAPYPSDGAKNVQNKNEIDLGNYTENPLLDGGASGPQAKIQNNDEIDLDMEDDVPAVSELPSQNHGSTVAQASENSNDVPSELREQLPASFARPVPTSAPPVSHPEAITNETTHFLALDKCLPGRRFLQILDVDPASQATEACANPQQRLSYDKEWLAITRAFRHISPLTSPVPYDQGELHYRPLIDAEEAWVEEHLVKTGRMVIPENFEITAPVYDPEVGLHPKEHPREYTNPQTVAVCAMLEMDNFFNASEEEREARMADAPPDDSGGAGGRGRGRDFRGRGGGRGRGRGRGRGYR